MGINMNWRFFSFALLVLVSCRSSKSTGGTSSTPIYVPQKEQTVPKESEAAQQGGKAEEKQQKESESRTGEPEKETVKPLQKEKSVYNIAVILPYMTDKIPLNYTPYNVDTDIFLSPEMTQSLDFYMGLKLATDDFKNKGKKINIFVLDDAGSDAQTRKLLSERPFPEVDVIISGAANRLSKEILKFSNEKKVPVYSPFMSDISQPSDQVYSALPNVNHQIEQLLVKMHSLYPEKDIKIIQDPNDDSSMVMVKAMAHFLKNELAVEPEIIRNTQSVVKETGETVSFYQPVSSNIVLIASNKEVFVRSVLPRLYGTQFSPYILGLPSWSGFRGLENETQPNPNIFIPAFDFVIRTKSEKDAFSGRFADEFQMEDNTNAYLGYDLMSYIMTIADRDKIADNPTSIQLGLRPWYYNFDFVPVSNQNGNSYFINSQVGFMKYEKGRFTIVKL